MSENEIKQKTVFLVDDDQFLLNMYAIKFQKNNYVVDSATSAFSALEKLRSGANYDAIVFDIVMPSMDGFEMAETIKKEKLSPNSVLVALTNQGQDNDIERGKTIGIDGYIIKASTIPSEVVKEVETILQNKSK